MLPFRPVAALLQAPLAFGRFLALVADGFFTDQLVYRALPGFVVQFGIAAHPAAQQKWGQAWIEDDPPAGIRFQRGTVSFGGSGGKGSRSSHIFVSDLPDGAGLGSAPHERPFGQIVDEEEQQFVRKCSSEYGDLTRLQAALVQQGNAALAAYPNLTRIQRCFLVPPHTDADAAADSAAGNEGEGEGEGEGSTVGNSTESSAGSGPSSTSSADTSSLLCGGNEVDASVPTDWAAYPGYIFDERSQERAPALADAALAHTPAFLQGLLPSCGRTRVQVSAKERE
jgi:peptidyl-prolyl cis-trans isomerase A (cyclophilin A)